MARARLPARHATPAARRRVTHSARRAQRSGTRSEADDVCRGTSLRARRPELGTRSSQPSISARRPAARQPGRRSRPRRTLRHAHSGRARAFPVRPRPPFGGRLPRLSRARASAPRSSSRALLRAPGTSPPTSARWARCDRRWLTAALVDQERDTSEWPCLPIEPRSLFHPVHRGVIGGALQKPA